MNKIAPLYDYLLEEYKPNEPIFLSDFTINWENDGSLRKTFKILTDEGKLRRFDNGIYYIPEFSSSLDAEIPLNPIDVIVKKYILNDDVRYGYFGGPNLFNNFGLTSQVPFNFNIVTNKATKNYKETRILDYKIIIKKPRTIVTEKNYQILEFLDLIYDIDLFSELEGNKLKKTLKDIIINENLTYKNVSPYFNFYPLKLYKNLIETGVVSSDGLLI